MSKVVKSIKKIFSPPKPKLPALPPVPSQADAQAQAREQENSRKRGTLGRLLGSSRNPILTSSLGVTEDAPVSVKKLLGS